MTTLDLSRLDHRYYVDIMSPAQPSATPLSMRLLLEGMQYMDLRWSGATGPEAEELFVPSLTLAAGYKRSEVADVRHALRTYQREGLPPIGARDVKPERRAQLLRELIACASPAELEDCAVRVDAALTGRPL